MTMYEVGFVHTSGTRVISLPQTEYLNADSPVDAGGKLYHRHGKASIRILCVAEVVESETMRRVNELADLLAKECPLRELLSSVSMTEAEAA